MIFYLSNFNQEYISEIITPWGLCHTFNMAYSHDLLDLNSTSDDFHYHHAYRRDHIVYRDRYQMNKNFPKQISTSSQGLWVGFSFLPSTFFDEYVQNDFDGYVVLFNDPFELPTFNSKVLKFNINYKTTILVNPQLNSIDESLYEYEPAEYVNVLNNFFKHNLKTQSRLVFILN